MKKESADCLNYQAINEFDFPPSFIIINMLHILALHIFIVQPILTALLASKNSPLPKRSGVRYLVTAALFSIGLFLTVTHFFNSKDPF